MPDSSNWTVLSSSSIGGSFLAAAEAGKYILDNGTKKRSLFWVGAGFNISVPGLPGSGSVSTSAHWSTPGTVYFSRLAPHRVNPYNSADMVFSGNGIVLEIGANCALADAFGFGQMVRNWARARGIQDWQNQACAQMLMFNTTNNLFGTILGAGLTDIMTILIELATTGDYTSINTQGIAFVASASTGVDTGGITATQGAWFLW